MRSSPEARWLVSPTGASRIVSFVRGVLPCFLLYGLWFFVCPTPAFPQDPPQTPVPSPAQKPESNQPSAEISTHDEPTTFKVNVKLVVVRAVVRDSKGNAVGNLREEDFQVFDKGKPQIISHFEVEQPGTLSARARQTSVATPAELTATEKPGYGGRTDTIAERFVAYLFDDVHLEFGDIARLREAADRHFATLAPTDRAAIITTSGQTNLDFTDDRAKLHETLLQLKPRPINSTVFAHQCPEISLYQADLIVNKNDPDARGVAIGQAMQCGPVGPATVPGGPPVPRGNPGALVDALAQGVLTGGEHESRVSLLSLKSVLQGISRMPGQREIVLVSPGFLTPDLLHEYNEIVDLALRSQVVISTLDGRGLYVIIPYGDASHQPPAAPDAGMFGLAVASPGLNETQLAISAAHAQDDLLDALAADTGGYFFQSSNDFDEGFRRTADTPEYSYVLAFTPQNLKLDGSYHTLKVTLKNRQKLSLQARRGYYAPKSGTDPNEQAKQEIEDAMYSQEEFHNLPIQLHTQFFKAGDEDAKLLVLAHVDVQHLHFRKVEGRNNNVLTCVSALFNHNGNFIQGMQKVVTMNWKDDTLEHKLAAGITLKTSYDVKPGSYLVRLVVRDADGQLTSENGTVEIR
jgi:VWFA-related protein